MCIHENMHLHSTRTRKPGVQTSYVREINVRCMHMIMSWRMYTPLPPLTLVCKPGVRALLDELRDECGHALVSDRQHFIMNVSYCWRLELETPKLLYEACTPHPLRTHTFTSTHIHSMYWGLASTLVV